VKTEGAKESEVDAGGELLIRLWPIAGAWVAVIVWLVRLEGKVLMNSRLLKEGDQAMETAKSEFRDHRREIWARTDVLRDDLRKETNRLRDLINGKK
jgi:hypothetical protein